MIITMYTDNLLEIGFITEDWWDEWTLDHGNLVDIDVPEEIVKSYYSEKVAENYGNIPFEHWYYEESTADDMDGLFDFTEWRPFLVDVKEW